MRVSVKDDEAAASGIARTGDAPRGGGIGITASDWGWRHGLRKQFAVRHLDLEIAPGEKVLLLGPSGAGKSTLLHALAGVLDLEEGDAEGQLRVGAEAPDAQRGNVGLVMQDPQTQIVYNKVGDEVAFACENMRMPRPEIWRRVSWALAEVGLDVDLNHNTQELSGGQQQRLALAAILAMGPQLLLLDEPTANLDPAGVTEVRDAVIAAQADTGATMLVVEHRVEVWADYVDRVIVLAPGGGLRASGTPAQVLADEGERLAAEGVWVNDFVRPKPLPAASGGQTLIAGHDLTIGYHPDQPVQEHVNIALKAGISTCIVGPNGAGKSTLAKTLGGLLPQLSGSVEVAADLRAALPLDPRPRRSWISPWKAPLPRVGEHGEMLPDPHEWASKQLLQRIGTVFQSPEHQFLVNEVSKELALGPQALGQNPEVVDAEVTELLERLRLTRLAQANPFTLSGGEKRRLSVATVLATAPRVIFLDEPTFGQDLSTWRELIGILRRLLDAGTTLVSVTHDRDFIDAMGQEVWQVDESGVRKL